MSTRFDRQLIMSEIGSTGQESLASTTATIVGVGGLGYPAASYMAAAGVGALQLIDPDLVDLTNLNRQLFYSFSDVGRSKVSIAARTLSIRFPDTHVTESSERLTSGNAAELLQQSRIVIDAVDNLDSRYVLNRWAVESGVPVVFGAVEHLRGAIYLFDPGVHDAPCYECLFPRREPIGMSPTPILGAAAGVIGSWQAAEAVMYICGFRRDEPAIVNIDIKQSLFARLSRSPRKNCFCHRMRKEK